MELRDWRGTVAILFWKEWLLMGMHEYLKSLSDLEMINRAPGYFKFEQLKVTQAAQMLGDIEEQAGNKIDWRSLYEKALNPDYTERFIGDIKTPVKYATHELRKMLARVDTSLTENFIKKEILQEFQEAYERRFAEGKDDTLEGKILSVADKIDLMYESFGEIQKGNPEPVYMDIYKSSLTAIMKFREMASVQYFLKKILPELLKDNADANAKNQLALATTQIIQQ